jgi:TonB family protein
MAEVLTLPHKKPGHGRHAPAVMGALLGAGFTLLLFLGLAHIEQATPDTPAVEFNEARSVAFSLEAPPPPPPAPSVPQSEGPAVPAAGGLAIEAGDSSSPARLTLTPRDIGGLLPARAVVAPVRALAQARYSDLKPKLDIAPEFQRIYQQTEVDERPRVLSESLFVPPVVRNGAKSLQATLLFVVDTSGTVASVRVLQSSGNVEFDKILSAAVREQWTFTPAIKRGKRVRCMVQRTITVKFTGSPFEN